ncbi:MAG: arginine deiminase-related protein [Candidatus Sulfotelmatobacter sp.]
MPNVLLCAPTYFDVVDSKNPYMSGQSPVNRDKAQRQWEALCSALEHSGYVVETIDPTPGLEDMVFAANQIFVGWHEGLGKFIVPSNMVHASRQREVPFFVDWYRRRGYKVIDLELGEERLEGHGDLLWHPGWSRVYAGYGFRTTRGGVEKFAAEMSKLGIEVVPLHLVDHYCYHLDTCLCPINNQAALIFPGAFAAKSLAVLQQHWKRLHELTPEEAHQFMGNGIVANDNYITPYVTPHLETLLKEEGLTPLIVDTSEFEKSGGSVFCMKAFLP